MNVVHAFITSSAFPWLIGAVAVVGVVLIGVWAWFP